MPWWGWVLIGVAVVLFVIMKVVLGKKFVKKMQERKTGREDEEILDE